MVIRIGTGSALLLGMVAFGSTQVTACDCLWGWCGGYGYYGGPAAAYYAPAPAYAAPAPAYYAPAPAYYAPAPVYAAPAPAYYAPAPVYAAPAPAYYATPAPDYYAGAGYAADAPPSVAARYYAAAPNKGYQGYAHASYRHFTQPVDGGKWDQTASMLGGPRKNIAPVANLAGRGGKAAVASRSGAQNMQASIGRSCT
jgi:hypothetical protein